MTSLKRVPAFLAYGQFGQIAILDCLVLAPLGALPLAAVGFAGSVLAPFFIVALGIALALAPLVAREERGSSAQVIRLVECLRVQGAIALVSILALLLLARHLDVFHQTVAVTEAARPHLYGMMFAMVPLVLFAALREWAIARGRRAAPMTFAIAAIVMKIALGYGFVRGIGPMPAIGILGASVSTILAYGTATLLFIVDLGRHGLFAGVWEACSKLPAFWRSDVLGQGLPVSLQQLTEVGALYITGIMAGWLSADALAAHSVAVNVINGAGLVSLALAQEAAIEVGKTAREGRAGIVSASSRCALRALGIMALIAAVVVLGRGTLFAATPAASALALVIAMALPADGIQMTLGGALRGLVDAKFLAGVTVGCWVLCCVPLSYVLAFVLHLGIFGIWASLAATTVLAATVLALRLHHLARARSPQVESALEVAS